MRAGSRVPAPNHVLAPKLGSAPARAGPERVKKCWDCCVSRAGALRRG